MPQTEFENVNLRRAYPLVPHALTNIYAAIVDLSVTIYPSARYRHGQNKLIVHSFGEIISLQAEQLGLEATDCFIALAATNGALQQQVLLFPLISDAQQYDVFTGVQVAKNLFLNVIFGVPIISLSVPDNTRYWSGYLTVGDIAAVTSNYQIFSQSLQVEPARILNTAETATSLGVTHVYNRTRTQYRQPAGCEALDTAVNFETGQYVKACSPITGPFRLAGGHSTWVSQDTFRRQLTVAADGSGGELGKICGDLPLLQNESDLDQSPRCEDVLRSINGVSGPNIQITALESVQIGRYADQHRLIIAPTGSDSVSCPELTAAEAVEYLPNNEQDQPCGNDGEPLPPAPGLPDTGVGYVIEDDEVGTTTTLPATMCVWRVQDDDWYLFSYPCSSPHGCSEPSFAPTSPSQEVTTACLTQLDEYGTYILNPYFLADAPFSAWDRVGDIALVTEDGTIPSEVLPVAHLNGASTGVSLIQRQIAIPANSSFLLQFECRILLGEAELAIGTESAFHLATRISLTPGDYADWSEVELGVLTYLAGPLRLVITAGPDAILDITRFALVLQ